MGTDLFSVVLSGAASAAAGQSHLYVALDLAYITQDEFNKAFTKAGQVAKTMNAFIHAVKRTGKSGLKALKES